MRDVTTWSRIGQSGMVFLLLTLVPLLVGILYQVDSRADKITRRIATVLGVSGLLCIAVAALGGIWS